MSDHSVPPEVAAFAQTLRDCRELYVSGGQLVAHEYSHLVSKPERFVQLMEDLHRALVLKIYFALCEADQKWSQQERLLAQILFEHLWERWLENDELRVAAQQASEQALHLKWYSLIRPFDLIAPLRDRVGALETIVTRLAHSVARADGVLHPREADVIRNIQDELRHHLRRIPIDRPDQRAEAEAIGGQAIQTLQSEADDVREATAPTPSGRAKTKVKAQVEPPRDEVDMPPPVTLEEVLAELDALIGLGRIKFEVRTLVNFLELQRQRREAGLPATEISLHMVFSGNPGTGKTSVARIVGKIYGAMGILSKGHLVETDRGGLVAEYAGQTAPKTNAKIDEALDGVLFIDEAYSLVAEQGEDPFGREAIQTLLKRAEDDRHRLVVILAGYTGEMHSLLRSNPGLSSRFNRQLEFDDYTPLELSRIFGFMCDRNHYLLASGARLKLLVGLHQWYDGRDRHFGNGRAVRNLFEHAIRRMANRLAGLERISADQLARLEAEDLEFDRVPAELFADLDPASRRVQLRCDLCGHSSDAPASYLGQRVRCPKCKQDFLADWGELV